MRTVEIKIYKFNELGEQVQEQVLITYWKMNPSDKVKLLDRIETIALNNSIHYNHFTDITDFNIRKEKSYIHIASKLKKNFKVGDALYDLAHVYMVNYNYIAEQVIIGSFQQVNKALDELNEIFHRNLKSALVILGTDMFLELHVESRKNFIEELHDKEFTENGIMINLIY